MTTGAQESGGIADESAWERIEDEDEVWEAPTELPPPLSDPAPVLLNTHEMGWLAFERLVLAMARRLDGAFDARRYGRLGQGQHGIDVVGFFTGRGPSVYQAKRWEHFGSSDLENAVERYTGGRRPFGAERIVVAVASEANDTATIEKLAELRQQHSDIAIELWDQETISERLRTQPQLVTAHFGVPTAAAFCVVAPNPSAPVEPPISADAVLRGPIAHLHLVDDLRRAEDALETSPNEAANLLEAIAARLETSGFTPHASPIRELQARALRTAGRRRDEAWARIDLGWHQLEAGDTLLAHHQFRQILEWGDDTLQDVVRCANALALATGLRRDYGTALEELAVAVDALQPADPHRVDAALVLAEEAVAFGRSEIVETRSDLLKDLAAAMPHDDKGSFVAARLLSCVADCCGGWDGLAASARDTYPPRVSAFVLARHARYRALVPDVLGSVARWRDAIERACLENLNDDAADWLYSLRAVRLQNGLISRDIDDLHRHAQALRANGTGSVLPEPYSARERALVALRDQSWPAAYEALRRYLWRSTIGADWAGEIDAHDLLGDLFVQTGRGLEAIQHYVTAGKREKLEKLAAMLPDEQIRPPIDLITPRPWERAAAFTFVAACGDLIPDEEARQWCAAALEEIANGKPVGLGMPDPVMAAFKAFGQLAAVSAMVEARCFLEVGHGLIAREQNTYRFTDEDQVHALLGIARAHSELESAAIEQLLGALLVDQRMAELVLTKGHDLLRSHAELTVARVSEAAEEGNPYAVFALLAVEQNLDPVVILARSRLDAVLAPRVYVPGQYEMGTGLSQVAGLVSVLPEDDRVGFARVLLDLANEPREPSQNRYEALVAMRGIAGRLPSDTRNELFEQIIPYASGQREAGEDPLLPGGDDPLRRYRLSLGNFPLAPAGLMAAAALAQSNEQYGTIEQIAVEQLRGADDVACNSIARALASIPSESLTLPLALLAGHPSHWLRALAAVVWSRRPDEPQGIGVQLARDPSPHVRGSLAGNIQDEPHCAEVRSLLVQDTRRSVRQQSLRPLQGR